MNFIELRKNNKAHHIRPPSFKLKKKEHLEILFDILQLELELKNIQQYNLRVVYHRNTKFTDTRRPPHGTSTAKHTHLAGTLVANALNYTIWEIGFSDFRIIYSFTDRMPKLITRSRLTLKPYLAAFFEDNISVLRYD